MTEKMYNFTASVMQFNLKKRGIPKITDHLGIPIPTLVYLDVVYPFRFSPPSINYNILQRMGNIGRDKEPQLRPMNIAEMDKLGYAIIKVPVAPDRAWGTGKGKIQVMFLIVQKGSMEERDGIKLLDFGRNKHRIEFDEANLRLRLIGANAGSTGQGNWVDVEK